MGRVDKLVAIVKVRWDYMPGRIGVRESGNVRKPVPQTLENRSLSFFATFIVTISEVRKTGNG